VYYYILILLWLIDLFLVRLPIFIITTFVVYHSHFITFVRFARLSHAYFTFLAAIFCCIIFRFHSSVSAQFPIWLRAVFYIARLILFTFCWLSILGRFWGWWVIIHNPFCLYFGHISVLEDTFISLFYLFRLDSRVLLFRTYRFVYLFRLDRRILLLSFIYSGSTAVYYYILYPLFSSARTPYI